MEKYTELENDVEICKKITNFHGKSYSFATFFFPKEIKDATYIAYAWMRTPDDIVDLDQNKTKPETITNLKNWIDAWYIAYHTKNSDNPILRATSYVFHKYQIPFEYSQAFLDAMSQDLYKKKYNIYQELEEYMYGSAGVVGLIMSHIIGFKSGALDYALKLGYAMQLTNFIRDLSDDYDSRGRIYFPADELKKFNITEDHFKSKIYDENFSNFLDYQIKRTEEFYTESIKGIGLLEKHGRFPVYLALVLYRAITRKIIQNKNLIFKERIKTTKLEKIKLLFFTILNLKKPV